MTTYAFPVSLAVVGFGLIGGSVALGARQRGLARSVIAIDREEVLNLPAVRGIADAVCDTADVDRLARLLAGVELTVLATPAVAIEAMVARVLDGAQVVTDCGSTKRRIVAAAEASPRRSRFVAGHPMAGRPVGGIAQADGDLFVDRTWILCPEGSDPDALGLVRSFVSGLGARRVEMSAVDHDRAVALTSHVPQLFASVLAALAEEQGAWLAAGPAFLSATRVAGGGEAMWRDILATNADEVAMALRTVADRLERAAHGLVQTPPDLAAALELLETARATRQSGR